MRTFIFLLLITNSAFAGMVPDAIPAEAAFRIPNGPYPFDWYIGVGAEWDNAGLLTTFERENGELFGEYSFDYEYTYSDMRFRYEPTVEVNIRCKPSKKIDRQSLFVGFERNNIRSSVGLVTKYYSDPKCAADCKYSGRFSSASLTLAQDLAPAWEFKSSMSIPLPLVDTDRFPASFELRYLLIGKKEAGAASFKIRWNLP